MYQFLVDISRKLDWPLREFVDHDDVKSQIENLFSLKDKFKKPKQSASDSEYQSKLNKQISFFGISTFFNKLNELKSVLDHLYSNKIILVFSLNDKFNKNENSFFPHSYLAKTLGFVLNIWHQLDHNLEYHNVISKCLNNCKLDNLYSLQQFINTFYSIYKCSLLNNQDFTETFSEKENAYWTRVNNISVLLLQKNSVNVRFFSNYNEINSDFS